MKSHFISVVLPIYNESGNIPELMERCQHTLQQYGRYEIVCVNDASQDSSLQLLEEYAQKNSGVKIIDFARNFGHQAAITAGVDFASGDAVIVMDSDLQDPPELIPQLVEKWQEGYEVVYAQRRTRKDTSFKKMTAFFFYRVLQRFSNVEIPVDTGDFRLMDRSVVKELNRMREHSRFMRGLTSWVGFRQTSVLFDRDERKHGETNYPLVKMLKFALDGITSFSSIPLRLATYFGFLTAFIGVLAAGYAGYRRFFLPESATVPGWTTIVMAVFLIGGVQLIVLGIIGEYIGRIYTEVQNRPLYVVGKKINFTDAQDS